MQNTKNGDMRLSIDNVPKELKLAFKSYLVSIDMTMQQGIMRLMERELKERWLQKQASNGSPPMET